MHNYGAAQKTDIAVCVLRAWPREQHTHRRLKGEHAPCPAGVAGVAGVAVAAPRLGLLVVWVPVVGAVAVHPLVLEQHCARAGGRVLPSHVLVVVVCVLPHQRPGRDNNLT